MGKGRPCPREGKRERSGGARARRAPIDSFILSFGLETKKPATRRKDGRRWKGVAGAFCVFRPHTLVTRALDLFRVKSPIVWGGGLGMTLPAVSEQHEPLFGAVCVCLGGWVGCVVGQAGLDTPTNSNVIGVCAHAHHFFPYAHVVLLLRSIDLLGLVRAVYAGGALPLFPPCGGGCPLAALPACLVTLAYVSNVTTMCVPLRPPTPLPPLPPPKPPHRLAACRNTRHTHSHVSHPDQEEAHPDDFSDGGVHCGRYVRGGVGGWVGGWVGGRLGLCAAATRLVMGSDREEGLCEACVHVCVEGLGWASCMRHPYVGLSMCCSLDLPPTHPPTHPPKPAKPNRHRSHLRLAHGVHQNPAPTTRKTACWTKPQVHWHDLRPTLHRPKPRLPGPISRSHSHPHQRLPEGRHPLRYVSSPTHPPTHPPTHAVQ